jgi:S-disulfanyl-L-cysteine oxidoreductase SoxD
MRRLRIVAAAVFVAACKTRSVSDRPAGHYGLGQPATAAEIASRDVDVGPDGAGLPPGRGSASEGAAIFATRCAVCHGERGEGKPPMYPALIGRDPRAEQFVFGQQAGLTRTIGNYWPNATTVFDYVRRAMPQPAPGSLTNDEVYALTAYLLAANQVIASDATLDSASLSRVKMPYASRFGRDNLRGGREIR